MGQRAWGQAGWHTTYQTHTPEEEATLVQAHALESSGALAFSPSLAVDPQILSIVIVACHIKSWNAPEP